MEDTMIFTATSTAEVALFNEPFIFQFFVYEYQTPNHWAVNHFLVPHSHSTRSAAMQYSWISLRN